jgi:hypothetical protein
MWQNETTCKPLVSGGILMRRISRLIFAASLVSLSALLPMGALAAGTLTEYVVGAEYAVGSSACGETGSFAGVGSATLRGSPNAAFNTTICHTSLAGGTAQILPGGGFQIATKNLLLVGQYEGGTVGPSGGPSPLYPGSRYFCKEVFPVSAALGPATTVPEHATNILSGTVPAGALTHIGVYTVGGCRAFAASITGLAILNY